MHCSAYTVIRATLTIGKTIFRHPVAPKPLDQFLKRIGRIDSIDNLTLPASLKIYPVKGEVRMLEVVAVRHVCML